MIADLEAGHRRYVTPGLVYLAALPAWARQELIEARKAEGERRREDAETRFRMALLLVGQSAYPSSLVDATRAAAQAGLSRVCAKDREAPTWRREARAWLEAHPHLLDAAGVADHASVLPSSSSERGPLLEQCTAMGRPPAWVLYELRETTADVDVRRSLAWMAVCEAPEVAEHHSDFADLADRPSGDRCASYVTAAGLCLAAQNVERASEEARRACELDDPNRVACLLLADVLRLQGDADGAVEIFSRIESEGTTHPEMRLVVLRGLARAYEADGRRRDAVATIQDALAAPEPLATDFVFAGRLQTALRNQAAARAAFDKAVALAPDERAVVYASVDHWVRQQRLDLAIAEVEKVIERRPADPLLHVLLGHLSARDGRPGAPDEQLSRAIVLGMDAAEAWATLADLRAPGDRPGAADALRRALKLHGKKDPALQVRLGELLLELRDHEGAVRVLRAAVRRRGHPDTYRRLTWALLSAGRIDDALVALDRFLTLVPDDPELLAYRGRAHHLAGDLAVAETDLRSGLPWAGRPWAAAWLYQLLSERTDRESAVDAFLAARGLDGTGAVARVLWEDGDGDGCLALVDGALKRADSLHDSRDHAQLLVLQGLAREQDGGDPEESLRRALEIRPMDAEACVYLAQHLARSQRAQEAREMVDLARAIDPGSDRVATVAVQVLLDLGDEHTALAELDEAINQIGEEPELLKLRVALLVEMDLHAEALELIVDLRRTGEGEGLDRLEGVAHVAVGEYAEAERLLERVCEQDPDDVFALVNLASARHNLGRPQEALELLGRLGSEVTDAEILWLRGDIRQGLGDKGCLADFEQALADDPGMSRVRISLVLAARQFGEDGVGMEHLRLLLDDPAVAGDPEIVRLAWIYGWTDIALERAAEIIDAPSEGSGEDAEVRRSNELRARIYQAGILNELGDTDAAIEAGRAAVALDDHAPLARFVLADALRMSGSPGEALAVSGQDADPLLVRQRVGLLLELGRDEEAIHLVKDLEAQDIDDETRVELSDTLVRYGRLLPAAAMLTRELPSPSPVVLRSLGTLLSAMGEFERAAAVMEFARRIDPSVPDLDGELAWAYSNFEDPKPSAVRRAVRRARKLDPDDLDLMKMEADALLQLGREAEARRLYKRVLQQLSSNPSARGTSWVAGWCSYRLGDYDRALDHLLRAISATTRRDGADRFDLGLALLAAGLPTRARREYNDAVAEAAGLPDPLRRHGVLRVALVDLSEAKGRSAAGVDADVAKEIESLLRQEIRTARSAAASKVRRLLRQVDRITAPQIGIGAARHGSVKTR